MNHGTSNLNARTGTILFGAALSVLLVACSGGEGTPAAPPPPPPVYIVKHMTADGTVMATYRARRAFADGGCVKFEQVGDPSAMAYRVVCGNVSVNPEEN